jgi:hypothetical protein
MLPEMSREVTRMTTKERLDRLEAWMLDEKPPIIPMSPEEIAAVERKKKDKEAPPMEGFTPEIQTILRFLQDWDDPMDYKASSANIKRMVTLVAAILTGDDIEKVGEYLKRWKERMADGDTGDGFPIKKTVYGAKLRGEDMRAWTAIKLGKVVACNSGHNYGIGSLVLRIPRRPMGDIDVALRVDGTHGNHLGWKDLKPCRDKDQIRGWLVCLTVKTLSRVEAIMRGEMVTDLSFG